MAANSGNGYQVGTTAAPSTARRVLAAISQFVGFTPPAPAVLQTGTVGANNAITWQAYRRGTTGNAVTVAIVVAGASTALSVSVTGSAITVNSATSAGSAATSTAAQVIAAVQANAAASALVDVDNTPGSSGAGVVAAVAATALAGGVDVPVGRPSNAPYPKAYGAGIPIHNVYK